MKLTLGKKLGLGFGALIALMVLSSIVAYSKLDLMEGLESQVVDQRLPSTLATRDLMNGVNHSLAALRGYVILGADPQKAKLFKDDRAAAWKGIDQALADLTQRSQTFTNERDHNHIALIKATAQEFRAAQQEVESIAQSDANVPAFEVLLAEAAPRAGEMLEAITAMIDEEQNLEATVQRKALLKNLADTRGSFAVGLAHIRAFLHSGDTTFRDKFDAKWAANEKVFGILQGKLDLLTDSQRQQWESYAASRADFAPLPTRMFELRSAPDWNLANYWLDTKAAPCAAKIKQALNQLAASINSQMDEDVQALSTARHGVNITLIAATSVSAILGCMIAIIFGRRITGDLQAVLARSQAIAGGDLTGKDLVVRSKDEFGDLTRATNKMSASLRNLVAEVSGSASDVAAAATEIAASSEEMAAGLNEQTQQVTQISSAIEEMSASVIEVARKSGDAASNATKSGEIAQQGGQVVDQTIQGMQAINEAVTASAASVQELGKRGEQIGQIIAVINDIADQTNLLALNAAIEAARAGEHGQGFAVVADEVRKLADRTTKATEEIGQSIQAIQDETTQAVQRMDAGTEQVQTGVERATQAGQSLGQIVTSAQEVAGMIQSIAAAADQQSAASEEVSRNVEAVSAVINQSSEGASQAAIAATGLSAQAEQLQALTSKFKIDNPSSPIMN